MSDDKPTIDDHPVCADCDGHCCKDWEWHFNIGDETRALMAEVGESVYMEVAFWEAWLRKTNAPPPIKPLRITSASPQCDRVYANCSCPHHNSRTGRCSIYRTRPDVCREFPNKYNAMRQAGLGCPLIDIIAAKPAPEDHKECIQ